MKEIAITVVASDIADEQSDGIHSKVGKGFIEVLKKMDTTDARITVWMPVDNIKEESVEDFEELSRAFLKMCMYAFLTCYVQGTLRPLAVAGEGMQNALNTVMLDMLRDILEDEDERL